MSYRVRWTETALRDLEAILDYVHAEHGVVFSKRLHDRLLPAIDGLRGMPERCRVVPELKAIGVRAYRELLEGPYRVVFRVRGREVVVLAALDGRRDLEELLVARLIERP